MDFLSWPRTGLGLCVVGGVVLAIVVPAVPVGVPLASACTGGLVAFIVEDHRFEHQKFLEDQRFEHEKLLREMDRNLRRPQQQQPDEVEMLHLLDDWTVRDEV
jgi:hypothetical protein